MILVLLGTQANDFSRLLEKIDKIIEKGIINEPVIVQAGVTKYKSDRMQQFDLIPKDEIDYLKQEARFIITHGGVGSIVSALKMKKKVIAVPRLKEYGEHVNNHQLQIVEKFEEQGYLIAVKNIDDLNEVIKSIDRFEPKEYKSNTVNMINLIDEYIRKN